MENWSDINTSFVERYPSIILEKNTSINNKNPVNLRKIIQVISDIERQNKILLANSNSRKEKQQ